MFRNSNHSIRTRFPTVSGIEFIQQNDEKNQSKDYRNTIEILDQFHHTGNTYHMRKGNHDAITNKHEDRSNLLWVKHIMKNNHKNLYSILPERESY